MTYTFFLNEFIQFPFQLLISESVFLIGCRKKEHFAVRFAGAVVLQFVLACLWKRGAELWFGESMSGYVLLYLGYAVLTVVPILGSFETEPLELVFILAGGYAAEHMTFAASKIILHLLGVGYAPYGSLIHLLATRYFIYIIGAVLVYVLIIRGNQSRSGFRAGDIRIAVLGLVVMFSAIGLSVYWSYPEEYAGTLIGEVICPAYGILCCALVLLMEYYVLRENNLKHEQEMMEQLLSMANSQQKSARDAIDIINIKCHDLKHQIRAMARMEDAQTRSDYMQEIQEAVSIYDATYHTGCRALDYVLREKTLLFNERQVEFSCMADGSLIDFMTAADVYALMGNALDNALESVSKEAEGERVISLQIRRRDEMALIHLENRCSREPEFQDGLPVTVKKDKNQHGFGVRSIRYIVEKYGGELFMSAKNGSFYLDILLEMRDTAEKK